MQALSNDEIKTKCQIILDKLSERVDHPLVFEENAYIAGGCIRSMVAGEEVKDFDVFLRSEEAVKCFRDAIDSGKLVVSYETSNAYTLYIDTYQIQVILTMFCSPESMIKEFDFTVNQNFYDPLTDWLQVTSYSDILCKQLRINKTCRNKIGTLARIHKFTERGYKCPPKMDLVYLGVQISKTDMVFVSQLLEDSKLYFSQDDMDEMCQWSEIIADVTVAQELHGSGL